MNQRDENFVSMCRAVQDVLSKYTTVWTPKVAFGNQVANFNLLLDEVALAVEGAEIVTTGATGNKAQAEADAIKLTVNLAKRGSVYALEVGNMELHDQLRVTKSTLVRRPDTLTLAKMRDIHSRLEVVVAEATSSALRYIAAICKDFFIHFPFMSKKVHFHNDF